MVDVLVEFDYDAEQEDELTIRVGDVIKNVLMSEGGWWEGELNGKKGMFPDNFVKVKSNEPEKPKEEPKKDLLKSQQRSSVKELANKLGVIGGSAPPKKRESQHIKKRAKVLFDYEPTENEDELKIEVGQIVEITKQEEDGWWEGTLDGKTGVFPSNFVELIDDLEPEHQTEKNSSTEEKPKDSEIRGKKIMGVGLGNIFQGGPIKLRTTQGTQKTIEQGNKMEEAPAPVVKREKTSTAPAAVVQRAIVRYSYDAQNDDELTLNENDIVNVLQTDLEDQGWWKVDFNGKVGVFPDNFVEMLPPEEPRPKKPPPPSSTGSQKVKAPEEKKPVEPLKPDHSDKLTKKKEPLIPAHTEKTAEHAKPERVLPQEPALPEKLLKKKENTDVATEKHGPSLIHAKKPSVPPPVGKKPANPPRPSSIHESKVSSHTAKEEPHNKDDKKHGEDAHFDALEPTSEKLVHLTASRAKGPTKRPPSQVMFHNEEERNGDVKDSHWLKEDKFGKKQPSPPHKETIKEEVTSKEKPHHLPARPPEPSAGSTALLSAVEELKRELRELKANTVSKAAFEELKADNEKMKHDIETLRTGYSRKLRDLINEVDEEKKIRLSTQVEIDRIKKLVNESHV